MKTYIVTVQAQQRPYEVKCTAGKDIIEYLTALQKQWPYFRLISIKQNK